MSASKKNNNKKISLYNYIRRNFNRSKRRKIYREWKEKIFFFFKKTIFPKQKKRIILNKKIGKTPLQIIEEYKKKNLEYAHLKMAYAGRLDPLASGKLLVLIGDECKKKSSYLALDKEYIFEIVLDFSSDSQDVLGLANYDSNNYQDALEIIQDFKKDKRKWIEKYSKKIQEKFLGKMTLAYPVYSSKTVQGKPLFLWALEGKINQIKIPKKDVEIYGIELIDVNIINLHDFHKKIVKNINSIDTVNEESKKLGNDFRRKEILERWDKIFYSIEKERKKARKEKEQEFIVLKVKTTVSSGTYMRTLSQEVAQKIFATQGLAYSIHRTKIGYQKKKIFKEIKGK